MKFSELHKTNKFKIALFLLGLVVGLMFNKESNVEIREVVKKEYLMDKNVQQDKDVVIEIKETKKDGTKVETKIVDKSKSKSQETVKQKEEKLTQINTDKKHRVELYYDTNLRIDNRLNLDYTYKVLNPVFLKLQLNKDDVRLGVGLEFNF